MREPVLMASYRDSASYNPGILDDVHSYAEPNKFLVRHLDLNLEVLFEHRSLQGIAILSIERLDPAALVLLLDTRELAIENVEILENSGHWSPATYHLGISEPVLGTPLAIDFPPGATRVRIAYSTSPLASGLQWLEPSQTTDKKHPFLFSQSQEIHARSWVPLQDTPGVRFTFSAKVKAPQPLRALMGASAGDRVEDYFHFRMEHPIPSYLLALAVGDIQFASTGPRTGVYAERSLLSPAAREFEDTEQMVAAAESLYGPYRWGRYDLLVLPSSFPFGGMENPNLTFISPTLITGDKGLISLICHELAHSWAGNLVTNATWSDFWLNEGFTTYIERRILEAVYGASFAEMESVLGRQKLEEDLGRLADDDQILHINLKGRDPDDGASEVPYEKGFLFLTAIEQLYGRQEFDRFLKSYFDSFSFQSITTEQALEFLSKKLLSRNATAERQLHVEQWIYKPGLPESSPRLRSKRLINAAQEAERWLRGDIAAKDIAAANWTTYEWRCFLGVLPLNLGTQKMHELDEAFHLTSSNNAEVVDRWLRMAARNGYSPAFPRLEEFLITVGRKKYIKPIYEELVRTSPGRQRAEAIYAKARPGYHPITRTVLDRLLEGESSLISSATH